jgi:hypothetical protein
MIYIKEYIQEHGFRVKAKISYKTYKSLSQEPELHNLAPDTIERINSRLRLLPYACLNREPTVWR